MTKELFDRYYFSRAGFVDGTTRFHQLCAEDWNRTTEILEIGAGLSNSTSHFLKGLGHLIGIDVSEEVLVNRDLDEAAVFDGLKIPFKDASFPLCVSNYVLEHISEPGMHFMEVARVLKPQGRYYFRTPNLWHYVSVASATLPHALHLLMANRVRGYAPDAHDPYPTVYRANTRRSLRTFARGAGLLIKRLEMVECEPCYGAAHPFLFWPMMIYERTVNRLDALSGIRANIFGCMEKP